MPWAFLYGQVTAFSGERGIRKAGRLTKWAADLLLLSVFGVSVYGDVDVFEGCV